LQKTEFSRLLTKTKDADIYFNEPMKNHTTFKIGGNADVFIIAKSEDSLLSILLLCKEYNIPFYVIGAGSNLLVGDKGIRGAVIKYGSNQAVCNGNVITAEAGISLAALSKFALSNSLSGLEFASGIPGFLGGAVYMNAGAYGSEMKDIVFETEYVDSDGNTGVLKDDEHQFSYRHSIYTNSNKYVTLAKIRLIPADKAQISARMAELSKKRSEKQPLTYPSAGSTFKRPEGHFAAKLIEDAGLKGYTIGGAMVSEKHSGFVINTGDATASDVLKLTEHIKNTVMTKFNVELNCEIKMIGEF